MLGLFYPLATLVAAFIIGRWLQFELRPANVSFTRYRGWLVAVLGLQIGAVIISSILDSHLGNFLLHSIGGGAAMTLLFVYFVKTFRIPGNWRLLSVALFAFVAAMGVVNELGEFTGELLGIGRFSFDTHDTWRDLFANTSGMVVAWLAVLILHRLSRKELSR